MRRKPRTARALCRTNVIGLWLDFGGTIAETGRFGDRVAY
jgi:hypothetical protein